MRILFLLFLVLLISCRCSKKETYLFTPTARDYFVDFGEGSYWVFQDADSAYNIDTLTLVGKKTGLNFMSTEQECDGSDYEFSYYKLLSAATGDTLRVQNDARVTADLNNLDGYYHGLLLNSPIMVNKPDQTFSVNTYAHDSLDIYSTYSIGGKTYADVMSMTFRQFSPSFPDRAPTYVYARHVGLIAFSLYNTQAGQRKSYYLKDYRIVR